MTIYADDKRKVKRVKNMVTVKATTQKGMAIIDDINRNRHLDTIWKAYEKPSREKAESFDTIRHRAMQTYGYNNDLHIVGHSSYNYSTIYTYTDINGDTYAVKDTACNTFIVKM